MDCSDSVRKGLKYNVTQRDNIATLTCLTGNCEECASHMTGATSFAIHS